MNQIATQSDSRMLAIEEKINRDVSSAITVGVGGITFQNAGEVMEYAKMMAVSGSAVPKHLRGQPGACLGIIDDAIRFRTSPYALARKSYFVNDNLAYEAQVIAGVINAFAPLKQRPDIKWEGEGPDRVCIVVAEFKDGAVREVKSPKLKDIHPKNSPLWKSDPDQQQSYYTLRSFARRWCPEIILGIYDVEEMRFAEMRDVSPEQPSVMTRLQQRQEAPQTREGFDQSFVTRETAALTGEADSNQTEDNSQSSDAPSPSDEGSDGAMSPGQTVAADLSDAGNGVDEGAGDIGAAGGQSASSAPAYSRADCVTAFMRTATDPALSVTERRELLAEMKDWWKDALSDDLPFVKDCLTTADKVAKGELLEAAARKYLDAIPAPKGGA